VNPTLKLVGANKHYFTIVVCTILVLRLRNVNNRQRVSMASKFKVARFDGTGNFGLCRTRVKDLLAQQGISRALDEKKPMKVDDDKLEEMQAQACAIMRLSR
jgi:hypothetical protein